MKAVDENTICGLSHKVLFLLILLQFTPSDFCGWNHWP